MAANRVIGANNALPWHLPEDLKRFRALTMGHHIVMGRKTYESLGRLLPGRTTVIVTRNHDYKVEGAIIAHSLEAAVKACHADKEVFIIGGAELYQQALSIVNKVYLTQIHADVTGDAHFPEMNLSAWREIGRESHVTEAGLAYSYVTYEVPPSGTAI